MENLKVEELSNFLKKLSLHKDQELQANAQAGTSNFDDDKVSIFKDLSLTAHEKQELILNNYHSIVFRVESLNTKRFFNESIMIAILFLKGDDENSLYDSNLEITDNGFIRIIYYLSFALIRTEQYNLGRVYIDFLQKLIIVSPYQFHPPKDIIDKMHYIAHSYP